MSAGKQLAVAAEVHTHDTPLVSKQRVYTKKKRNEKNVLN
jgi:hypothetical protein